MMDTKIRLGVRRAAVDFGEHLRTNKSRVVRRVEVLVDVFDPTYGRQDPRTESLEVIDFEALLREIDEFSKSFMGRMTGDSVEEEGPG